MRYQDLLPKWNKTYIQFIKNHEKNNWSWEELSCNENITVESIKQNPELPWCWNTMSPIIILLLILYWKILINLGIGII